MQKNRNLCRFLGVLYRYCAAMSADTKEQEGGFSLGGFWAVQKNKKSLYLPPREPCSASLSSVRTGTVLNVVNSGLGILGAKVAYKHIQAKNLITIPS